MFLKGLHFLFLFLMLLIYCDQTTATKQGEALVNNAAFCWAWMGSERPACELTWALSPV